MIFFDFMRRLEKLYMTNPVVHAAIHHAVGPGVTQPSFDILEEAFGLISSVSDWTQQSAEWQAAAVRFREKYQRLAAMNHQPGNPCVEAARCAAMCALGRCRLPTGHAGPHQTPGTRQLASLEWYDPEDSFTVTDSALANNWMPPSDTPICVSQCKSQNGGIQCTREPGHSGRCAARGDDGDLMFWHEKPPCHSSKQSPSASAPSSSPP